MTNKQKRRAKRLAKRKKASIEHQFVSLLIADAENNFDKMIPYTEDMQALDELLIKGVLTDDL